MSDRLPIIVDLDHAEVWFLRRMLMRKLRGIDADHAASVSRKLAEASNRALDKAAGA